MVPGEERRGSARSAARRGEEGTHERGRRERSDGRCEPREERAGREVGAGGGRVKERRRGRVVDRDVVGDRVWHEHPLVAARASGVCVSQL